MRMCAGPAWYSIDHRNEQECSLPALRDHDFCLYHGAREIVDKLAPEFSVQISEPEPVSVRAAHEPEVYYDR